MAIYSLHVSNVSRAAGSSAVASCSYITSRRMRDERTGEAFNGFGRRERVEHVCTMLPEGAPGEYLDPERLFNAVEMAEKRSDARPAKKIMVALPREFDARERFRALEDFISWNITANGYACTYAIHTDKDGRNPHAHILVANRRIDPKTGRWAAKSRSEFALDANGRRIPVIDPDTGRQKIGARNRKVWKRVNVSNNPLDSKEFLERLRREWADSCNALLPGYAVIDHRSFKARGIERIPTIHEGYASREMEKRGGRGDLCEENRRIQALNRLLDALRAMIGRLSDQAQGILTAVKRRQRPSGAPQAPSSPEPAERPQERPQARETPPQAPQEPPKPIRTKKARGGAYDDEGRQTFSDGLNGIISVYDPSRGGNVDMRVIDVIDRRIPRLPRSETTTGTAAAASRTVQATAPQPARAQPQSFTPNPQRIEHRTGAQQPDRWA